MIILVVIGVLAGIVIPIYVGSESDAMQATVDSIASGLNVAAARNHILIRADSSKVVSVSNCTGSASLLPPGQTLPCEYSIDSAAKATGAFATCTVWHSDALTTATFMGYGD